MRDWTGKRYWLVGASEGLGLALAQALSRAGAEVILSARNADRLADAVAGLPGKGRAIPCNVNDLDSVRSAAEAAGPVDGILYLAGVYWPMRAADWNPEQVEAMCDTNFTGAARVLSTVLPGMVARGQGHIVLIGSLAGQGGEPGAAAYAATKAGIAGLADALRDELAETGVQVQLAHPGFIRTRLSARNTFHMPMLMEPEDAAREIFEHMNSDSFGKSFPLPLTGLMRLSRLLPRWARPVGAR